MRFCSSAPEAPWDPYVCTEYPTCGGRFTPYDLLWKECSDWGRLVKPKSDDVVEACIRMEGEDVHRPFHDADEIRETWAPPSMHFRPVEGANLYYMVVLRAFARVIYLEQQ